MTPVELRNLLLPLDLCLPSDTHTSMTELIYVLQTDLVLPVTREDQLMLLQEYGDDKGDVNVRALLSDAGVWHEIPTEARPNSVPRKAGAAMSRIRAGGIEDPLVPHGDVPVHGTDGRRLAQNSREGDKIYALESTTQASSRPVRSDEPLASRSRFGTERDVTTALSSSSSSRPDSRISSRPTAALGSSLGEEFQATGNFRELEILPIDTHANDLYGDLINRSATNSDYLSEIHRIVATDLEETVDRRPASPTGDPAASSRFLESAPSPTQFVLKDSQRKVEEDVVLERTAPTQVYSPQPTSSPSKRDAEPSARGGKPLVEPGTVSASASDPNVLSLAEENARLRSELKAFDGEFWEQLEDLKFRYSRLQEVVGEEPDVTGRGIYPMRPKSSGGAPGKPSAQGQQPLDALPWSARNAMTAMDRAGITSSLARGRYGAMPLERPESRSTDRPYSHAYSYAPGARVGSGNSLPVDGFDAGKSRGFGKRANKENDASNTDSDELPGRAPLLRHSTGSFPSGPLFGGIHGVGGGTHAPDGTGSLASMCERRLLFELGNHPAPEQAARQLIHRIQDVAHRKGERGRYITCNMLSDVLASVSLRMTTEEVTILATGFGSNGKGGIDSQELSEALQALLYNFIGEHEVVDRERRAKSAGQRAVEQEEDAALAVMVEICQSILTHDKKAIIGAGASLYDTLVDPFAAMDTSRLGVLAFTPFSRVLRDLGVMLDHQETLSIATRFEAKGSKAAAALGREFPSDGGDFLRDFKDERLQSSLRGHIGEDPSFGKWLASNVPGKSGVMTASDSQNLAVDYTAFVAKLSDIMETIIDREGGLIPTAGLGGRGTITDNGEAERLWMLKEFDLIEALICQLELMRPSERRRCLLSLQYAVTTADAKNEGEIDGFSLLSALLGAGFRLQRLNRVRLLRAIEELGGKVDHVELCQVLIRSCADWTSEERGVVSKILKAMGVTVLERRAWIGRVRVALMKAAADYGGKAASFQIDTGAGASAVAGGGNDPGIPPSAFLHIMRENGVILGVEEEATLLDCLDTERLADLGRNNSTKKAVEMGPEDGIARAVASIGKSRNRAVAGESDSAAAFGAWGVPMIHFKSFLAFCARHTGDWMDAAPENTERINEALRGIQNPVAALQEFTYLLHAFDETSSGFLGNRAFQIACHRSRLFANLSDDAVKETADILTAEGGGKIRYTPFLVHLRAICGQLTAGTEYPGIGEQLLKNASDAQATLLPLRNWLLRNTDTDSCLLTPRDLNSLLREFSVMYRPEDLEALLMGIGRSVGTDAESSSSSSSKHSVLNTRDLFRYLFKIRGPWTLIQTDLCQRMVKCLALAGAQSFASGDGDGPSRGANSFGFPKSPKGIESAAARRLLARLRAFADIVAGDRLVDLDIFGHVARVTGLALTDEELLVLADATDPHPCARQVRCDVVVEALSVELPSLSAKNTSKGVSSTKDGLSEAAQYALKHTQDQLWTTGLRLKRSPAEWIADVKTVFRGFDHGGAGFITTEDFSMALSLLNASVRCVFVTFQPMYALVPCLTLSLFPPSPLTAPRS